jgi:fucose 4-O-acetylase-like acetyltransferase
MGVAIQNRDRTLDVAKGVAITLVVFGHALQYSFGAEWEQSFLFFSNIVFKIIYSFHMPLLMMISGYLFYHSNQKEFRPLVYSKVKSIGIPMVTFMFLCNILTYIRYLAKGDIIHFLLSLLDNCCHGMAMWFLFSVLLNMLIVSIITRLFKRKSTRYLLFFIVFLSSLFIPDSILLSVHKYMFPFFCIGYVLKENNINLYHHSSNRVLMVIATLLSICALFWFDEDTYIYTSGFCVLGDFARQLYIDSKRLVIALIVSFTFIQYVHLFTEKYTSAPFSCLGRISLFIYGSSVFIDTVYSKVFSWKGWNLSFNYIIPALFTLGVLFIATILYKLISKNKITSLLLLGK